MSMKSDNVYPLTRNERERERDRQTDRDEYHDMRSNSNTIDRESCVEFEWSSRLESLDGTV